MFMQSAAQSTYGCVSWEGGSLRHTEARRKEPSPRHSPRKRGEAQRGGSPDTARCRTPRARTGAGEQICGRFWKPLAKMSRYAVYARATSRAWGPPDGTAYYETPGQRFACETESEDVDNRGPHNASFQPTESKIDRISCDLNHRRKGSNGQDGIKGARRERRCSRQQGRAHREARLRTNGWPSTRDIAAAEKPLGSADPSP